MLWSNQMWDELSYRQAALLQVYVILISKKRSLKSDHSIELSSPAHAKNFQKRKVPNLPRKTQQKENQIYTVFP